MGGAGGAPPFDAGPDGPVSGYIVSALPGPDATKVDTHAAVSLTLDRAAALSDASGVVIESTSGVSVSATASVAGNTLTLKPDVPLDMNATYRVRVRSPLGASSAMWTFTTADGALRAVEDLFYAGEDPNETSRVIAAGAAIRTTTAMVAYRTVSKVAVRRSLHGSVPGTGPDVDAGAGGLAPLSWQPADAVADAESDHLPATDTTAGVSVGVDGAGNAVVVWNAPAAAAAAYSVFASRYSASTGRWSPAERLEHDTDSCPAADGTACGVSLPQLTVGLDGTALVAWERWTKVADVPHSAVWAAAFSGGAWTPATALSGIDGREPAVTENGVGQGAIVWTEPVSGYFTVQLRRFTAPKTSWDIAHPLVLVAKTHSHKPYVGLNDRGTLLASWTEWPGTGTPQPGDGATRVYWETPMKTAAPGVGPAGQVNVSFRTALGSEDGVIGAWGAQNPHSVNVVSRSLDANEVWPAGMAIDTNNQYVADARPTVDAQGRGLVGWLISPGPDKPDPGAYVVRYDPAATSPSGTSVRLTRTETESLDLAMDPSGRGLVTWILPHSGALEAVLFD